MTTACADITPKHEALGLFTDGFLPSGELRTRPILVSVFDIVPVLCSLSTLSTNVFLKSGRFNITPICENEREKRTLRKMRNALLTGRG